MCDECGCESSPAAPVTRLNMPVYGMQGEECAESIKQALANVKGVSNVEVSVEKNQVSFELGPCNIVEVKQTIRNLGFNA